MELREALLKHIPAEAVDAAFSDPEVQTIIADLVDDYWIVSEALCQAALGQTPIHRISA